MIDYENNKLSNVVGLLAQHITLVPIITTVIAKNKQDKETELLASGQAINQFILSGGFCIGITFLTNHLKDIGQPGAAIATAVTLSFLLLQLTVAAIFFAFAGVSDDPEQSMKNSAIAGNPVMWPLIGSAFAVDSIYNHCQEDHFYMLRK